MKLARAADQYTDRKGAVKLQKFGGSTVKLPRWCSEMGAEGCFILKNTNYFNDLFGVGRLVSAIAGDVHCLL